MRHILLEALKRGWRVYLVDPKGGVDYLKLEQQLAEPIAMTSQQALPLLQELWSEHLRRLAQHIFRATSQFGEMEIRTKARGNDGTDADSLYMVL
ncbi:hypothetical protein [Alicyclobacillus cellulosilyticus]|uniref:hypothetical protein n=1 Tax=Alicyclobacillus cellulosilyticus TaxID=1003997 RepID=UPI001E3F6C32